MKHMNTNEITTLGTYNDTTLTFTPDKKINLTDMWKAGDGRRSQRPANWLVLEETKRFLKSLEERGNVEEIYIETQRGGTNPGTWGHYQIALSYAKYLSPEFHIWCNEVVKEHIETQGVPRQEQFQIPQTLSQALMLAAKQAEQLELQEATLTEQAPKVEAFETLMDTTNSLTFTEAAKALGFRSADALISQLRKECILFKRGNKNLPCASYVKYFEVIRVVPKDSPYSYSQTRVKPEGLEWLRQKYALLKVS